MQGLSETFDVEETRVESTEPFHMAMLGAMPPASNPIGPNCNKFRECHCALIECARA